MTSGKPSVQADSLAHITKAEIILAEVLRKPDRFFGHRSTFRLRRQPPTRPPRTTLATWLSLSLRKHMERILSKSRLANPDTLESTPFTSHFSAGPRPTSQRPSRANSVRPVTSCPSRTTIHSHSMSFVITYIPAKSSKLLFTSPTMHQKTFSGFE